MFDQGGVGGQIRHVRREIDEPCTEDTGQAHQRCIDVKIRKDLALWYDLVDPAARCHQSSQRLLACHDDIAAACLHQGCIADELKRVTQAVVGVQQNRPPGQARAIPKRLAENGYRKLRALEPPFVLGPSSLEVAHLQPDRARLMRTWGWSGLSSRARSYAHTDSASFPWERQRISQVVVSIEVGRIEFERPAITSATARSSRPCSLMRIAQVTVGFGIVGLEHDGPLQTGQSLRRSFLGNGVRPPGC